jgi:hemolysin activation/secretion protein
MLLFGELNTDAAPALGYGSGSLSYGLPLGESLRLSTAFGASRRHLIELEGPSRSLSYRQLQTLLQLDATLAQTSRSRWYSFAGLSANRADSFQGGRALPLLVGASADGWLRTGYLRLGFGAEGDRDNLRWSGSVYGLQGLAGLSTASQQQSLALFGIQPGEARAVGLQSGLQWRPASRWQVSAQAAAQQAFAPLTAAMGLSLGSDNGLRGLPGQVISGDSGLLGEVEVSWSAWRGRRRELQLVPFLGAGLVRTEIPGGWIRGDVGATGVLLRWLQGNHWLAELGWVSQFGGSDPTLDNHWLLSNGLYSRIQFRF